MLTSALLFVFVVAAGLFLHSYALYPLSLVVASALRGQTEPRSADSWPHVAVVIAAYNEETIIAEKIENTLSMDYSGRFDVIVFSDASSDRTDEIVRRYEDRGVELVRIEGRVGKTACQNRVAERVDAGVIVFSDANSMYEPDAIRHLVEGFGPGDRCVIGELRYRSGGVEGESLYWRYERQLKRLEDATGTTIAGNGAIYAVDGGSYVPLDRDETSDFAEPLSIVREGGGVSYAPDAVAYESTGGSVESELSRRIRIATRSWHTLWRYRGLLNPLSYPEVSYKLWSHKLLRWLSPVFLVLVFVSSLSLAILDGGYLFQLLVAVQLIGYLAAGAGWALDRRGITVPSAVHVPYYFLVANYGLSIGLVNFLRGDNIVAWETDTESRQV